MSDMKTLNDQMNAALERALTEDIYPCLDDLERHLRSKSLGKMEDITDKLCTLIKAYKTVGDSFLSRQAASRAAGAEADDEQAANAPVTTA